MAPSDPTADILARIAAAARLGDRTRAEGLAVAAFRQGVRPPLVVGLVAEGLVERGRQSEALALLRQATDSAGDDRGWGAIRLQMGRLLLALDRREAVRVALARGLEALPDDYRGLIDAGTATLRLGDLAAAADYFRRAAVVAPELAEPLSALAVVASLEGDAAAARNAADRALALDPQLVSARIAIARADALDGDRPAVLERTGELLQRSDLSEAQRVDLHDLRADCLDTLDRTAEAFADYLARNQAAQRLHGRTVFRSEVERPGDRAVRLRAWFAASSSDDWRPVAGPDTAGEGHASRHVFLVGFPRSGTTLLEKVLASHPQIVTLEEVDILGAVGESFLADAAGLRRLSALTPPEAAAARGEYWRGVRAALGAFPRDRILVDKLPLHTPALPVIAALFPDARVIFALRDPRDVVLSCFRRRFRINAAMFEFLTLEGAARYYDTVMALAALYRERLPLPVCEVRHEALVADFDVVVRHVLDFIGAAWDPRVREFTGQVRGVPRTPSAPQVARGLNADGVGQWRRYGVQLEPVRAVLAPWVERFGYQPG